MEPIESFIKECFDVFDGYQKPEQCIDHQGDPEYKDYEDSLVGISRNQLTMNHIGHSGYGPLSALGPEAVAYYLPKLIEFAVLGVNDKSHHPFMLYFTMVFSELSESERCVLLGHEQREIMLRVFMVLKGLYYHIFKEHCYDDDLDSAIDQWKI